MKDFDYDTIKTLGINLAKNDNDFNGRRSKTNIWIKEIQSIVKKLFFEDEYINKLQILHDDFEKTINEEVNNYNKTAEKENANGFGSIFGMPECNKILSKLNNILNQEIYQIIQICSDIDATSKKRTNFHKEMDKNTTLLNENIFIVHGHNNEIKQTVARTVSKLNFNPIILHEHSNSGNTIIEKFEELANSASYAIILLTDDDLGKAKSENKYNLRARQNVIMELGYFLGRLGRNRVFVLKYGEIETPSDIMGVVYNIYDGEEGGWRNKLVKEMKAAGFTVDANNL